MKLKKVESSNFFLYIVIFHIGCCVQQPIFSSDFTEYHIVDTSRQELYPHDSAHPHRELMMHVWIPDTVQDQKYPLIIFSHGLGKTYNGMSYSWLCKSIAERGYVVASVSHTYACKPIQFPDGRVARYVFQQNIHHSFNEEVEIWVDDMVCALNECARYNACEDDFLYHKIDLSRVGMIGHSLGGSTALQICRRDSRVAVAIDLDGPLYGADARKPLNKPLMFIFGSLSVLPNSSTDTMPMHYQFIWRHYFNRVWLPVLNAFIASLSSDVSIITIEGIVHDTFSDYAFSPDPIIQPWLIDGAVAQAMIRDYVCDFFDRYLMHS
ncbi:MAG TPA: hypothetical protein VKR54_03140 [Candidatus Babeliales bacterium]|nr:hypothetical protein [Candidatus Babeliales bacterium]